MTTLIDGYVDDRIAVDDRAVQYGDGVYRTLEWRDGRPLLWDWQWRRLRHDAAALGLALPAACVVLDELERVARGLPRAVCKIILTRASARRGYAIPPEAATRRIVSAAAWDGYPPALAEHGVATRLCGLRLGLQPRLAGIKHLNRLENVLARSEWTDTAIHEGLMLDSDGSLVEATMSNLFVVRAGELATPALDRCGVAGAVRAWVLDQHPTCVRRLDLGDLENADEAFLCNSLIGIWPIARFGQRVWRHFPLAHGLAAALRIAK